MSRPKDESPEILHGPENNPNYNISPSPFVLAHIFKATSFIDQLLEVSDTGKLLSKIEGDKLNINTTLLQPTYNEGSEGKSLKINTFADGSWSGNPGVLFRNTCLFLAFYENDIGSSAFKGFDNNGAITPAIMHALHDWAKGKSHRSVYKGNMKLTPQRAIEKLEEIAIRRIDARLDHASTIYFDVNGNKIYTGAKSKFSKKSTNRNDQERDPEKLRHNETHVRANISDIEGFFVTQADWNRNYYNAIYLLNKAHESVKNRNLKLSQFPGTINMIQKRFENQIMYYRDSIKMLTDRNAKFEQCLASLEEGKEIENKELDKAFVRKKKKNQDFDEKSPKNKEIWLKKHIKTNDQDIEYLQAMVNYAHINLEEDAIKADLEREPQIYIYDVNKGLLKEITKEEVTQKLDEISLLSRISQAIGRTRTAQLIKARPISNSIFFGSIVASSIYVHPLVVGGIEASIGTSSSAAALAHTTAVLTTLMGSSFVADGLHRASISVKEAARYLVSSINKVEPVVDANIVIEEVGQTKTSQDDIAIDIRPEVRTAWTNPKQDKTLTQLIEQDNFGAQTDDFREDVQSEPLVPHTTPKKAQFNTLNTRKKVLERET